MLYDSVVKLNQDVLLKAIPIQVLELVAMQEVLAV